MMYFSEVIEQSGNYFFIIYLINVQDHTFFFKLNFLLLLLS